MKMQKLDTINTRLAEIRTEARALVDENGEIRDANADRFDELAAEADTLKADKVKAERTLAMAEDLAERGCTESTTDRRAVFRDGQWHYDGQRNTGNTLRDQALRAVERNHTDGYIHDDAAAVAEALVERSESAREWASVAGDPHYASAFAKMVRDTERGHMLWTPQEQRAFQLAQAYQQRDMMIGTGSKGGLMVPMHLDPAIILTNNGTLSPLRQVSRVVTISGASAWNGISSAGASSEWIAESTEVADGSPTLAQPSIPVHKYDCFVPYSVEVEGDAANFLPELQRAIVDSVNSLHDTAYTIGTGSGQPTGIVTALAASSPSVVVAGGGTEVYDADDPYKLQNALGARFQANAQFMAALPTINTFRKFETTAGAWRFPELRQNPLQLLGRNLVENSVMDSTLNAAATEANYGIIYGDFQNFVIVDRVGTTIELVPHLFGSNGRPKLQRGVILWGRTGSDSVNDNAFRMLNVATTA
ncbi:phage major capsid protein [Rhodococcus artemisiae]|uniref:Phage major capsid protein n=1 Tax=Rhodococcus artemisiae TaxID=714159 RepID=A0ABU7L4Z6_9NOCA|nr:phage major capsid protein [Rhodococcus artemisiae]MEE2056608.1 phage major capsid protein [Rhodococcus artemisiae]